jgi:hypothetical protein
LGLIRFVAYWLPFLLAPGCQKGQLTNSRLTNPVHAV